MPFKIKNQLFLDFIPIEDRESEQAHNNLYQMHLIETHTLAKFDITSDNEISIKWLSSKELVKFIEKYMDSKDEDKWKTDIQFDLKRIHE